MGAIVLASCATCATCGTDAADAGRVKAGRGCVGVGPTPMAGNVIGAIVGGALAGVDCVGSVGILGQLKLGLNAGVCTGTETAAEDTEPVMVCCGRTGTDDQANSDGLTVGVEVSTSGADENASIDPKADVGMGADEGGACNAEAAVAFVGNDQTEFAGEGATSAPGAACIAASAAAAAPNPFHVPVEDVGDPTGLLEGKDVSTSGAHLKTGAVAAGAEAMDTEVSSGLEIEANELGVAVND